MTITENGCVGCTACLSVCPHSAVRMIPDARGFYVAAADENLCVSCGLCRAVCPQNETETRPGGVKNVWYQYAADPKERQKSASGGAFYQLAGQTLAHGGYVCGCVWDERFCACHVVTNDPEIVKKMRGSKYVQSDMKHCFAEIRDLLTAGRDVLFSGTGCQTTGLIRFVGETLAAHLTTVALVCGGVPSPRVFWWYKNAVERAAGSPLTELDMRSKRHGWLTAEWRMCFANGKCVTENTYQQNLYGTLFNEGLTLNEPCMHCRYHLDRVRADLLIADHWGIDRELLDKTGNRGASCILALTEKGETAIRSLGDGCVLLPGDLGNVVKHHGVLTRDHKANPHRDAFFNTVTEDNILPVMRRYYRLWEKESGRSALIPLLYKLKLYNAWHLFKWKRRHPRRGGR